MPRQKASSFADDLALVTAGAATPALVVAQGGRSFADDLAALDVSAPAGLGRPTVAQWHPSPVPMPRDLPPDAVELTARRLRDEAGGIDAVSELQEPAGPAGIGVGPAVGLPMMVRGLAGMVTAPRDAVALRERGAFGPSVELNQPGIAAGSDVIEGALQTASPALVVGAVAAPVVTGVMVLSALAGEKAARAATKAAGGSEEAQRFAGNLGALAAGAVGAKATSAGIGAWKDARLANATLAKQTHAAMQELHVDRTAALKPDTIRAAFIARAKATHPDLHPTNPKAADQFAAAKQAYQFLVENPPHESLTESWRAALTKGLEDWFTPKAAEPAPVAADAAVVAEPANRGRQIAAPNVATEMVPREAHTIPEFQPLSRPLGVVEPAAPVVLPEPAPVAAMPEVAAPETAVAPVATPEPAPVVPVAAEAPAAVVPEPVAEVPAESFASDLEASADDPAVDVSGPIDPIEQAKADWLSGRAYIDGNGNYHLKPEGASRGSRGPIAPWNKAAKQTFTGVDALHRAAHGYSEPVTTPTEMPDVSGLVARKESEVVARVKAQPVEEQVETAVTPGTPSSPEAKIEDAAASVESQIEKTIDLSGAKSAAEVHRRVMTSIGDELKPSIRAAGFTSVTFQPAGLGGKRGYIGVFNGKDLIARFELEAGGERSPGTIKTFSKDEPYASMTFPSLDRDMNAGERQRMAMGLVAQAISRANGAQPFKVKVPGDGIITVERNPYAIERVMERIRKGGTLPWKDISAATAKAREASDAAVAAKYAAPPPADPPRADTVTASSPEDAAAPAHITLTGDEIGKGIEDIAELRKAAVAYYEHELRGRLKFVERPGFGRVAFTRTGRNKTISNSANPDTLRLIAAVPAIIERGEYLGASAPEDKTRSRVIKAFHVFSSPVSVAGRNLGDVRVSVWEDANGHKYYNVTTGPKEGDGQVRSESAQQSRGIGPGSSSATSEIAAAQTRGLDATKDSIGPESSPVKARSGRTKEN